MAISPTIKGRSEKVDFLLSRGQARKPRYSKPSDVCFKTRWRATLPDHPALDLKGTFICQRTGDSWLSDSKKDRDHMIHRSGWT